MTNITFKNGLPLLLQPAPGSDIGLVAADSGCCCPPPPPERCWNCLGSCAYFIEIEVPQGVSAKSAANFCEGPSGSGTNQSVFLYPDQAPGTLTFKLTTAQAYNSGGSSGEILSASVFSLGEVNDAAFCEFSGYGSNPATHASNVYMTVSVECREVESGSPFFVRIGGYITSGTSYPFIIGTEGQCASGWQWYFEGEYQIPSECVVSPSQQCDGYDGEFRQITTPLTFTIDGTTCSLGAFSSSTVSTQYESAQTFELVESVGEDLRDAFTATINITARENCLPPENVCCCLENTVTLNTAEECDGTTSPVADPIVDLEDITIVVDWDGLTATLDFPNFSESASEAVDFSCQKPNDAEAFDATERYFQANFFPQNDTFGECRWFSSNITAFISGTFPSNNFAAVAQSSTLGPYVGECKLLAPADENDTSCTFTQNGFWCMDNPFSDTVTVEMIIAP